MTDQAQNQTNQAAGGPTTDKAQGSAGSNQMQFSLKKVEETLELYLVKKAPTLPLGAKEFIVKYGPYITLVLILLALPVLLAALGLGAVFMPLGVAAGARFSVLSLVSLVLSVAVMGLELAAVPGLLKRQKSGWNLMFYSGLVGVAEYIVRMDLFSLVIGSLITFYIIFQVKEYYK